MSAKEEQQSCTHRTCAGDTRTNSSSSVDPSSATIVTRPRDMPAVVYCRASSAAKRKATVKQHKALTSISQSTATNGIFGESTDPAAFSSAAVVEKGKTRCSSLGVSRLKTCEREEVQPWDVHGRPQHVPI